MLLTILLLLLSLSSSSSSLGADVTLSNVEDFINFASDVNEGNDYSRTTVYLNSDFSFYGITLDPIGINETYQFRGVFDGQGHIISNLQMSTSSNYTGLFGYSQGLTIRNVVLDDSCYIESTYSELGYVYVGGIIGRCEASIGTCNIENNVNMAGVTFSGSTSSNLFIGGVVGNLPSSLEYNAYAKNCVNYGSVTDSGTVSWYAQLGGIVGLSIGYPPTLYSYVHNCLNYGTVMHVGTSAGFIIGGVVGNGYYTYIENCVSAGKIDTQTTPSLWRNYIGSIVGVVQCNASINYCYYTNDVNVDNLYEDSDYTSNTTGTPNFTTSVNSELINKLNSNATSCNWDNWFMLHLNGGSINNLTQEILVEIQGNIPGPVKEGNSFLFWCKDAECTKVFDPATGSIDKITDLYAGWANGTVTFDFDNGTTVNETFSYNTEIVYPEMKKEGYTFSQWDNHHELMPARDITVTVQWTANDYTVTFDANGGDDFPDSEAAKIVTFNEEYGDLPMPTRAGFMFIGWWFTNETNETVVTSETIVNIPDNHTLYAHWEEVTNYVEIVFNKKDLTREEAKNIIKQYTSADFTIEKFEKNNKSGEINVIIKFADESDAENLVESIKGSSDAMRLITRIDLIPNDAGSFSTMICPFIFFSILFS